MNVFSLVRNDSQPVCSADIRYRQMSNTYTHCCILTLDRAECFSCVNKPKPCQKTEIVHVTESEEQGVGAIKSYTHRYPLSNGQSQSCSQKRFGQSWGALVSDWTPFIGKRPTAGYRLSTVTPPCAPWACRVSFVPAKSTS